MSQVFVEPKPYTSGKHMQIAPFGFPQMENIYKYMIILRYMDGISNRNISRQIAAISRQIATFEIIVWHS